MNILFVCTGNVFRSMTSEYCFKDFLKKNNINSPYTLVLRKLSIGRYYWKLDDSEEVVKTGTFQVFDNIP